MNMMQAISIGREMIVIALLLAAPMLLVGLAVGLVISILQAVTQINEMTLTFVPKIILVWVTGLIAMPWMIMLLTDYTNELFITMVTLIR